MRSEPGKESRESPVGREGLADPEGSTGGLQITSGLAEAKRSLDVSVISDSEEATE